MLTMYSTTSCGDCKATKLALEYLGISYTEVDIDQHPEGEKLVIRVNQGKRSVPTLVYGEHASSMSRFSIGKLKGWLQEAGVR